MGIDDIIGRDYPDFNEHGTAPCAETDPDAFFPEMGGGEGSLAYAKMAILVCNDCPYKKACLEYALKYNELGIWGGTSEVQRRRMRMADRVTYPKKR
jgi:hypothetical protein